MKKLKPGQIFNYNGLLWQAVKSGQVDGCLKCDLIEYYIKECNISKRNPCLELCSQSVPSIPFSCTIKLVSKNENARRKIREDAC